MSLQSVNERISGKSAADFAQELFERPHITDVFNKYVHCKELNELDINILMCKASWIFYAYIGYRNGSLICKYKYWWHRFVETLLWV